MCVHVLTYSVSSVANIVFSVPSLRVKNCFSGLRLVANVEINVRCFVFLQFFNVFVCVFLFFQLLFKKHNVALSHSLIVGLCFCHPVDSHLPKGTCYCYVNKNKSRLKTWCPRWTVGGGIARECVFSH